MAWNRNAPPNQEEIFGPVATLQSFGDENDALRIANGTPYGLAASSGAAISRAPPRCGAAWNRGLVWVNTWMLRDLRTPLGGVKHSGVGREGGFEAHALLHRTSRTSASSSESPRHDIGHRPFIARARGTSAPTRMRVAWGICSSSPAMGPRKRGEQGDSLASSWTRPATSSRYDIESAVPLGVRQRARHPRGRGLELGAAGRRDGLPHRHGDATSRPTTGSGPSTSGQPAPAARRSGSRAADADRDRAQVHRHACRRRLPCARFTPSTSRSWIDEHRHLLKPPVGNKQVCDDASSSSWSSAGRTRARTSTIDDGRGVLLPARGRHDAASHAGRAGASTSRSARARSSCCRRTCRTRRSARRTRSAW